VSFEQADRLQRDNGYLPEQILNLYNLGTLRIEMGQHEQAHRDLAASRSISLRIGHDFGVVCAEFGLCRLAVIQSDFASAEQYLAGIQARISAVGDEEAIQVRWLTALTCAARGELAKGLECAQQALHMARVAELSELEAECLRVLGVLRMGAGDHMVAEALFYTSIAVSRRRNDLYRHGLTLLELGRLYERPARLARSAGEPAQACAAYADAASLFARLGAAHELGLAQAAVQRLTEQQHSHKEVIWCNFDPVRSNHRPATTQVVPAS
jgi:tetratricopeptide (TPR) repeat protein